jgi:NAD-dependent DNA ligase
VNNEKKKSTTTKKGKSSSVAAAKPARKTVKKSAPEKERRFRHVSMAGEVVVFTGFRDKQMEEYLISHGAVVKNHVSKDITLLVCLHLDTDSEKMKLAKKYKAFIMELSVFEKWL